MPHINANILYISFHERINLLQNIAGFATRIMSIFWRKSSFKFEFHEIKPDIPTEYSQSTFQPNSNIIISLISVTRTKFDFSFESSDGQLNSVVLRIFRK